MMPVILDSADLTSIIEELRCRLLAIPLTDARITSIGKRLLVDARFDDRRTIGNVLNCCDALSQQTGIPISVTCLMNESAPVGLQSAGSDCVVRPTRTGENLLDTPQSW